MTESNGGLLIRIFQKVRYYDFRGLNAALPFTLQGVNWS
jgi:hypothetical protein